MADNVEIQGLEFEIEGQTTQANKGIDSLVNSLSKLKSALKGASGLNKMTDTLGEISQSINGTQSDKLTSLSGALSGLGNVKISATVPKRLSEIGAALDTITWSGVERVEALSGALQGMSGVQVPKLGNQGGTTAPVTPTPDAVDSDVDQVKSKVQSLTSALQIFKTVGKEITGIAIGQPFERLKQSLASIPEKIKQVTGRLQGMYSEFKKSGGIVGAFGRAVKTVFKKSATGFAAGVRQITSSLSQKFNPGVKQATMGLGKFFTSLKRIALYRAIRFFFSQLTQAMKEGINNLYQYSSLMGGQFKGSMDSLATSFQYLKNSMGAMVSPLINMIAPAVDFLIDKFVTLLNVVNQFFARLSGATSFTKAKKAATSYGAALGDTAGAAKKAAKEIKDATTGIDELNIISQNDDAAGGGGSGGGGGNYGDMFETVPIDSAISDFADKLKAAFEAGDWKELGTVLGGKLNDIVKSIDWVEIGQKIGYYINGAIQTAYFFLKTTDFIKIGDRLAALLSNVIKGIDFEYVGRLFIRGITWSLDVLLGFLKGLDWGEVAKSIGDFFKGAFEEAVEWLVQGDWSFFDVLVKVLFVGKLTKALMGIGTGLGGTIGKLLGKVLPGVSDATGKTGGFSIPSPKTVLKGLADIAIIVGGVITLITAVGLLTKIPGFEEASKSGLAAVARVFNGLFEMIIPLALVAGGITLLGQVGIPTIAKGFANLAIVIGGASVLITAIGAFVSIPYFKDFLSTGIESMKAVFNGLSDVALPIGILSGILIGLGIATPAVILSGLAGFALVIGGLELVLVALGALNQIPGFSWIVGEGGKVLMQLGEIMGGFAGSLIKGFVGSIASGLPDIGTSLGQFMINAQPFFNGLKNIDPSLMEAVGMLAQAVLVLTAADVLKGLTSWFTGGSSFVDFGKELNEFAPYFVSYYEKIKGIDGSVVQASAAAAKSLAEFGQEIPNMGGVPSWFAGENDMSVFGEGLEAFGKSFKLYYDSIKGVKPEVVEASASAAKALAGFAKEIPNMGGVASWFAGENDMAVFGEQLATFGKYFKQYSEHVDGIDLDVVTASASAAESLAILADMIPNSGGLAGLFAGNNDIDAFGEKLASFGSYYRQYYDYVSGTTGGAISTASDEMVKILAWVTDVASADTKAIDSFGSSLVDLGEDFQSVGADIIAGFTDKISSAYSTSKSSVVSWGTSVKDWFTNSSQGAVNKEKFATYANDIINGFKDKISSTYSTAQSSVTTWAKKVLEWFSGKSYGDVNKERFATYANDIINGFKDKISSTYSTAQSSVTTWAKKVLEWFSGKSYGDVNKERFATYANDIINGFKDKISSSYTAVRASMETWGENVKSAFTSKVSYSVFYQIGKDIVNGFDGGLAAMMQSSVNTVKNWSDTLVNTMRDKLGIHSPSRIFGEMAVFSVLGYNREIARKGVSTKNAIKDWADSFTTLRPTMAMAVDTSALKHYDSAAYARSISANVQSRTEISSDGFLYAMETFYHEYMEPTMTQMAGDMRRQADKKETTEVHVGNRVITDAVETQQQANGFRFVTP